jgi:hypothetical protein
MVVEGGFGPFFSCLIVCNEDRRSSSRDSKVSRRCSIGAVSGNSSMVVHNVGISHSIGRVASIPWTEVEQCKTSGSFDCRAIIP